MPWRLDHAGIYVDDIVESERFLGETLGLPLARHSTPAHHNQAAFYSAGNATIEAVWFPDAAERRRRFGDAGAGVNFSHIALGVDDLGAALATWRGRGAAFTGAGPTTSASRTMQMSDPATTGGVTYQLIQWYSPTPEADMPPAHQPARASGVGITSLDHVAIVVADYDAAKRQLMEQLGCPLTYEDAVPERGLKFAYFGLINSEIEIIAFADPARRAAALPNGEAARLDHIGLRVATMAETGAALQARGVAFLTPQPGQFKEFVTWNTQPETSMGVRFQLVQRV